MTILRVASSAFLRHLSSSYSPLFIREQRSIFSWKFKHRTRDGRRFREADITWKTNNSFPVRVTDPHSHLDLANSERNTLRTLTYIYISYTRIYVIINATNIWEVRYKFKNNLRIWRIKIKTRSIHVFEMDETGAKAKAHFFIYIR